MARKETPNLDPNQYKEIELPQSIIDSFARFLVPEIRKYYESEQGQREFEEWRAKQETAAKQKDE